MDKTNLVEIKNGQTGTGLLIERDGYLTIEPEKREKIMESMSDGGFSVPNPFIVDAVFQKFGIKNANGRIYPEEILKKQVQEYQTRIDEHRAYGECNHPSETTIDLGRISHNIIELHWEGRTLVGKMELNISEGFRRCGICSTYGDTVANLLLNGYKIGVSSRGVGSVEQKFGNLVVGDDFELICFDIVSDPSTPNAWLANGHEKLQSYIETEDKTKGGKLKKIDEKLEKIKNILEN